MVIGEPFSPYMRFVGPFIPLGILRSEKISEGSKLLLARLYMYAGKDVKCNPSLPKLASDLGVSIDKIGRWLSELVRLKYISRVRLGPARNAECVLLLHRDLIDSFRDQSDSANLRNQETFTDSVETQNQDPDLIPQICTLDSANLSSDSANLRSHYKEEEIFKRSSKENITTAAAQTPLSSSDFEEQENAAAGWDFSEKENGEERTPKSSVDDLERVKETILSSGVKIVNPKHPAELLKKCFEKNLNLEVLLAFIAWKTQTGRIQTSGLLVKSIDDGDIDQFLQTKSGKLLTLSHEADRQDREKELREKLQMETRTSLDEALKHLRECLKSPASLVVSRLKRRNVEFISPAEIHRMDRELLSIECDACRRTGTVGSPLTASLAYCECAIGTQEAQEFGESFLESENAKSKADLKTRMIAGSRELGNHFTGDALEHATFIEKPNRIDISVRDSDLGFTVTKRDVEAAAMRIGEERLIALWNSAGYRACQYCADTGSYRSASYRGMKACWSCQLGQSLEDIPDAPIKPVIREEPAKSPAFPEGVQPFRNEAELMAAVAREQATNQKGNRQ
jgi:hypothetical protein